MEENPVKPCPFCGSDDVILDVWHTAGHTEFAVVCQNCSASGPFDLSVTKAEEMWNMRRLENKALDNAPGLIYGPHKGDLMREVE